uniref:Retrovirus-related Pol polyprotein from transposon TNT 1-94 n=1 Tax=Cajanus cajan TaxID=3821 RepID=A0A151RXG9_CAJCA|nr:hypothetical protein KK1_031237 [Cajanus cajan]
MSSNSVSHTFSQSVTCKLDERNFMTWQQQVTAVIRAHDLERFVVNPKIPLKFLTPEDRDANLVNPEYTAWDRKDSLLVSWLLATLSESIQARVVSCRHSYQIWDLVFQHFQSLTKIKATQLRLELRTIKKGTRSCSDYLLRISTIVETLASIGSPISPREHAECILGGLPPEYDSLISTVTAFVSRDDHFSPAELETMILAQEARLFTCQSLYIYMCVCVCVNKYYIILIYIFHDKITFLYI